MVTRAVPAPNMLVHAAVSQAGCGFRTKKGVADPKARIFAGGVSEKVLERVYSVIRIEVPASIGLIGDLLAGALSSCRQRRPGSPLSTNEAGHQVAGSIH